MTRKGKKTENEKGNNLAPFIAGVIIGAALTYLFANKEGRKLKDTLLSEGAKILGSLGDVSHSVKEEIEQVAEQKKEELSQEISHDLEEAKEKVETVIREVPQQVEKVQKKGRRFFFSRRHSAES